MFFVNGQPVGADEMPGGFGGFPGGFGGFPGGMGGGMGGGRGPAKEVDNSKYYEILEVEKDANETTIKKQYRKKAIKLHPDKGGDPDEFKLLGEAYSVLSDKEKRNIYDKYGEEGLKEGGGMGGGDPFDIFSAFFGGGGGMGGGQRMRRKTRDFKHTLKLSLEDIYKGVSKKLQMSRNIMNEQGQPIRREKTVLDVKVDAGAPNGKQYRFKGMADEMPGCDTGDVIITIMEKPHSNFHRKGNHLFLLSRDCTLGEALTGFEFTVKTLDNRELHIKSSPGEITLPENHFKCIYEEGMPVNGNKFTKGNLYIQMNVKFPEQNSLSEEQIEHLKAAFGTPEPVKVSADAEEHVTLPITEDTLKRHMSQSASNNYDSDDEDEGAGMGGGQRVQCAQQ